MCFPYVHDVLSDGSESNDVTCRRSLFVVSTNEGAGGGGEGNREARCC